MKAPGIVGVHLLRHETPAIAATVEQKIRGGDRVADWVLVNCAYDAAALDSLSASHLSEAELVALGVSVGSWRAKYSLSQSATPRDMA